jgi:hypothetical protein
MNALKHFISAAQSGRAIDVTPDMLGSIRKDSNGRVVSSVLGAEITDSTQITKKMADIFASRSRSRMDAQDKKVQDAAANFVTNGLRVSLGASEDVRRGQDSKYIFVPKPGLPLALQSRNMLPPGAQKVTYKIRERAARAGWVNPSASAGFRSLPRGDYSVEEKEHGAAWYAAVWSYAITEEWEASLLDEDLIGERQGAAIDGCDEFREHVSGVGDVSKKIPGMFTLGDAILILGGQQFSAGVTAVNMGLKLSQIDLAYQNANNEAQAMRLIAPVDDKTAMQNTYYGDTSGGDSVWKRYSERYPWLQNAIWTRRVGLGNAAGNASRWVLYPDDQKNLYIEHTESMLFGPFPEWFEQNFVILRRHGGVVSKKPEQVMYVDFTT